MGNERGEKRAGVGGAARVNGLREGIKLLIRAILDEATGIRQELFD